MRTAGTIVAPMRTAVALGRPADGPRIEAQPLTPGVPIGFGALGTRPLAVTDVLVLHGGLGTVPAASGCGTDQPTRRLMMPVASR